MDAWTTVCLDPPQLGCSLHTALWSITADWPAAFVLCSLGHTSFYLIENGPLSVLRSKQVVSMSIAAFFCYPLLQDIDGVIIMSLVFFLPVGTISRSSTLRMFRDATACDDYMLCRQPVCWAISLDSIGTHFVSPWYDPSWLTGCKESVICL